MCVCRITRESMQKAFGLGITSFQIISFIKSKMKQAIDIKNKSFNFKNDNISKENDFIIPPTVIDQILIWESERQRLKYSNGLLLENFNDEIEFENVLKDIISFDKSQLLYQNLNKKIIVIATENNELIERYINNC